MYATTVKLSSGVTSVAWVVIAYALTIIDAFSTISTDPNSNAQGERRGPARVSRFNQGQVFLALEASGCGCFPSLLVRIPCPV
jgi:hypothetical protein